MQLSGGQVFFFIIIGLLLAVVLYALRREWRYHRGRQTCALVMNEEGLWPAHLDKADALVRWMDIDDAHYDLNSTKGALILQGKCRDLIRIDRRLADYEALCTQIFLNMRRPIPDIPPILSAPKETLFLRWFVPCLPVPLAIIGWATSNGGNIANIVFGLLLFTSFVLARHGTLRGLTIDRQGIALVYQGFRKPAAYRWDEIKDAVLQTQGAGPVLDVKLLLKNGQSILLPGFSGDSRSWGKENKPIPCADLYRLVHQQLNRREG